jgi:hypothetical protein
VSGSYNEGAVSEAFKDLLKRWGRQHNLVFSAQYEMKGVMKNSIRPDGALLHELRMQVNREAPQCLHFAGINNDA